MVLSRVITHILLEYGSKRLLKLFQPLLVVGIIFHVICHLLMCIVTLTPVEKITLLEKGESDKNRFVIYFGEVYVKKHEISFLQAILVSFAPSFLPFWFFIHILNILIHNQVYVLTIFLLIFIMISLVFSATPSLTDLEIIPEAFQNDTKNSLYQILLIVFSGLITWHLINAYNLQLSHEIIVYLIIAGFYFLFKYGFKITGYILSSINTERNKPSHSLKIKPKKLSPLKHKSSKKPKKKKVKIKKSLYIKKLMKQKEKDSSITENIVRKIEKHMRKHYKKFEFKNKILNKVLTNEITENNLSEESQINSGLFKENVDIRIPYFREKIIESIKNINSQIYCTTVQKELILSKSIEILDNLISRAENNEFSIPKEIDLRLIVATIIYTSIISNKNMPRISIVRMSEIAKVNSNNLGYYYRKYFKNSYHKSDFFLSVYRLGRINNYISLLFFEKLKLDIDCKTSDLIKSLKKNVLNNVNLPAQLTQKDINTLREIIINYQEKYVKYFSDLVEIVRNLIISSITHKKINALLSVNSLVAYSRERNINLLQRSKLYNSIDNIFNFLKEKYPDFFPIRWGDRENLPKKEMEKRDREYRRIIGSKLKLYVLKNIYHGKYYKDGIIKCPECFKERLKNNINSLRLKAFDCHHDSAEKENIFKSDNLYLFFNQNRGNPNVLEDLINLLESEGILLLCRNHHRRLHFNDEFDYIINWKDLFSLPAELIHLIVKISINNFNLTKNLSHYEKASKKKNIIRKIKKRYIIENFYGEFCHICGEFGINKDLNAFDFHHKHENPRNIKAHELYDTHSCPEIVEILIQEKGGYLCSNCHTVIHYKLIHLLNDIYEDKNVVKKILNDYDFTNHQFTLMKDLSDVKIKAPLKKMLYINKTYEKYLTAIYEISKFKNEITISDLASFTGLKTVTIHKFFYKNSRILKQSLEMKIGVGRTPTRFVLTKKGREYISLLYHFKNYYSSL